MINSVLKLISSGTGCRITGLGFTEIVFGRNVAFSSNSLNGMGFSSRRNGIVALKLPRQPTKCYQNSDHKISSYKLMLRLLLLPREHETLIEYSSPGTRHCGLSGCGSMRGSPEEGCTNPKVPSIICLQRARSKLQVRGLVPIFANVITYRLKIRYEVVRLL